MPERKQVAESPLAGVLIRIAAVFVAILALNLAPQAIALTQGLEGVQQALENRAPRTALQRLEWVLAHEPWRGPSLWRLIRDTALVAGDLDAASAALNLLVADGQAGPADWLAQGDALWQVNDPEGALKAWQHAVEAAGANPAADEAGVKAATQIVEYYRSNGNLAAEITALRQLNQFYPLPASLLRQGVLLSVFDPAQAVGVLESIAALPAAETESPSVEQAARLSAGLQTALQFDEPAYLKLQIGRLLGSEGYWELAYYAFYEAVQLRPDIAEGWAYLAESSQQAAQQGEKMQVDEGLILRWLAEAHKLAPESLAVNAFFGLYWMRQDAPEQAIPYLQSASELDSRNPIWQQALGAALAATGDMYAAQAAYRRAVDISPSSADAWRVLAEFYLHYEIELETEGLPAAQRAAAMDGDNPANQDAVGLALLLLGRMVEAEAYFQKALELDPGYAPALLHLGGLYLDRGLRDEAAQYLEQALALVKDRPADTLASADLRRLQAWLNQGLFQQGEP